MSTLAKGLTALAALGFALAVASHYMMGPIMGVLPHAFSEACTNLALLAIAVMLLEGASGKGAAGKV